TQIGLTGLSRRGDRVYRGQWVRSLITSMSPNRDDITYTSPLSWQPDFRVYRNRTNYDYSNHLTGATVYYVDPVSGSDGNSGLTEGLPLKTLAVAFAKTAGTGTMIYAKPGRYYHD